MFVFVLCLSLRYLSNSILLLCKNCNCLKIDWNYLCICLDQNVYTELELELELISLIDFPPGEAAALLRAVDDLGSRPPTMHQLQDHSATCP